MSTSADRATPSVTQSVSRSRRAAPPVMRPMRTRCDVMADLAERYGHGELRISATNRTSSCRMCTNGRPARSVLSVALRKADISRLQTLDLISDIIACPGMDYCALATARSIPVAQRISERFGTAKRQAEISFKASTTSTISFRANIPIWDKRRILPFNSP